MLPMGGQTIYGTLPPREKAHHHWLGRQDWYYTATHFTFFNQTVLKR